MSERTRPAAISVVVSKNQYSLLQILSSLRLPQHLSVAILLTLIAVTTPQAALPIKRVAKTYASSLRQPLTSARRTRPKLRKRKSRIRKTKRTRRMIETRKKRKRRIKKTTRASKNNQTGVKSRKKNTASGRRKRRDAGSSTRSESNANVQNMKSAYVRRKLKLDREEKPKRLRGKRKSKKIGESQKRGNVSSAR